MPSSTKGILTMADEPGNFQLDMAADERTGATFRWTLMTDMGQTIATSEWFPDRESAERTIQWLKENVANCSTLEPPYHVATTA